MILPRLVAWIKKFLEAGSMPEFTIFPLRIPRGNTSFQKMKELGLFLKSFVDSV